MIREFKCKCGNDRFNARQVCHHDVIVKDNSISDYFSSNGNHREHVLVDDSPAELLNTGSFLFDRLIAHVGHDIEVVTYGGDYNVSIECVDCYEVLYSVDNPVSSSNPSSDNLP